MKVKPCKICGGKVWCRKQVEDVEASPYFHRSKCVEGRIGYMTYKKAMRLILSAAKDKVVALDKPERETLTDAIKYFEEKRYE